MKTIFKQKLDVTDLQVVELPVNSKFLTIQMQDGVPCLWYEHNSNSVTDKFNIYTFGTGHEITHTDNKISYLATYQSGIFVGHVYYSKQ